MTGIIGIDLGTRSSAVAIYKDGHPTVITTSEGGRVPSLVTFNRSVATTILQCLKREAESYLGVPVRQAVLAVPSYFDDKQREAAKEAGRLAGIDILHILDEPAAAALAYSMPDSERRLMGLAADENIDPQGIVALGAALQARLLGGDVPAGRLKDVTSLSLGLETMGGLMTTIIPRNTPVPVRRTEIFSTSEDGQTEIEVHVVQGERPMASDNTSLGVLQREGMPAAPRGVPQIEVTFEVGSDGILHVNAEDLATAAAQTLSVTIENAVAATHVQRLLEEAASHEVEDSRRRALIEAQNLARQTIYQTERCVQHLNGLKGRSDCKEKREEISVKVEALQAALVGRDVERIRTLTVEVRDTCTVLNQLAYSRVCKEGDNAAIDRHSRSRRSRKYAEIIVEQL